MITLTSIMSALLLYVLPTLVGRAVVKTMRRPRLTYPFVTYMALGSIALYAGLLAVALVNRFANIPFSTLMYGYFAAAGVISLGVNALFFAGGATLNSLKRYLLVGASAPILALGVYGIWQINSPYGFNWDLYEHQTLVNNLIGGRLHVLPSQVTDTFGFNGYSTMLHGLIGASQLLIPTDASSWWHSISILHFMLFITGTALLAYEVTKRKEIVAITALISAFIFDSNISFTTLFFIPQTFTAVSFLFLIAQLASGIRNKRLPHAGYVALGAVFLVLNHYIIGSLAAVIYIGAYLYAKYPTFLAQKLSKKLVAGVLVAQAAAQALFFALVPLGSLNHGEAESFISTLPQKFADMQQTFGYLFLIFLAIAAAHIIKSGRELERMTLVGAALLMSLILQQAPYVMKFYVLAAGLINILMALGIYEVMKMIKNRALHIVAYLLLVVALATVFISNAFTWQEPLAYRASYAHVSGDEMDAATFLEKNYKGTNTLLVSDPATSHVLEPFSQVNTQGGAYMNSRSRQALDEISQTTDTGLIARRLYDVTDRLETNDTRLFALSGRYFVWQSSGRSNKYAFAFNIWHPADLTLEDEKYIQALQSDAKHFKLVYRNESIAIFEVSL